MATHATELTSPAHSPNANCISAEVTGEFEARLYQYVPGQLASQYTFRLETTTGIDDIAADNAENICIYANDDILYVIGIEPTTIDIYTTTGALAAQAKDVRQTDVSALPAGVYVVKATDANGVTKTAKVSIR